MRLPLPDENQMQVLGKKIATNEKVSGIQGPPGTGKSVVGAYLAVLKAADGERVLCKVWTRHTNPSVELATNLKSARTYCPIFVVPNKLKEKES